MTASAKAKKSRARGAASGEVTGEPEHVPHARGGVLFGSGGEHPASLA